MSEYSTEAILAGLRDLAGWLENEKRDRHAAIIRSGIERLTALDGSLREEGVPLGGLLLGLIRKVRVDNIGCLDLRMTGVRVNGEDTGTWHLTLEQEISPGEAPDPSPVTDRRV